MSDKKPSIRDIIESWKTRHGKRFYDRKNQLKELYSNFKHYGYSEDDITPSVKKMIVDLMYLSTWPTAKAWKAAAEEDLDLIHNSFWPPADLIEHNPADIALDIIVHKPQIGDSSEQFMNLDDLRKDNGHALGDLQDPEDFLDELKKEDGRSN